MDPRLERWGACPDCGANDGALRLPLEWPDSADEWPDTVSEWYVCLTHRKKWRLMVVTSFESATSALAADLNLHNDAIAAEATDLDSFEDVTDEMPEDELAVVD